MDQIYNFATVEKGPMYRGPGQVIGVIAIPADALSVKYRFRDNEELAAEVEGLVREFEKRAKAAEKANLSGLELFRTYVAPRQADIRFVPQGTRYCEGGKEPQMMDELFQRFAGWREYSETLI